MATRTVKFAALLCSLIALVGCDDMADAAKTSSATRSRWRTTEKYSADSLRRDTTVIFSPGHDLTLKVVHGSSENQLDEVYISHRDTVKAKYDVVNNSRLKHQRGLSSIQMHKVDWLPDSTYQLSQAFIPLCPDTICDVRIRVQTQSAIVFNTEYTSIILGDTIFGPDMLFRPNDSVTYYTFVAPARFSADTFKFADYFIFD